MASRYEESLNSIAELIETHETKGSPLIDAPDVINAIAKILADEGFLAGEEEGEGDNNEDEDE